MSGKKRRNCLPKNILLLISALLSVPAVPLAGQIRPPADNQLKTPQQTTQALLAGQRVMHTFDFEERELHDEILPMYWTKVTTREGFPHYAKGKLDSAHHRSGQYSFLLIPDGGSLGYEYHARRIPVKSGSDFQITGFVHLENASSCRAQISCNLTDRAGNLIEKSRHNSRLVGIQDHSPDDWARLEIYVPGNFPDARFLTISVWLLQEEQWNQDALIASPIFRRDVKALAWFDDITIFQMPRVTLRSNRPGNVFDASEPAILQVEMQGVASLDYQALITVQNAARQLIHQEQWLLTGIEGETTLKKIELPPMPAGLYHVRLEIFAADTLISDRQLTFAQLAPLSGPSSTSGTDFGILALDSDIKEWNTLYELTRLSNAKLIKLPVWRRRPELPGAIFTESDFDEKLFQLQKNNVQVMATFSEIPDNLALKMQADQRSLLDLLNLDPEIWQPQVAYVLAQYALQVPYWQIGPESNALEQTWDPRIRPIIENMRVEFQKLVSNTLLAAPLNCMFQVTKAQIGTPRVTLYISSTIAPQQIPYYLDDCRRRDLNSIWATIEPLDQRLYHREHRIIDFAKRVAFAKKGHAETVFINHPWQTRPGNVRQLVEPTELFLVFRTLADHLGAARFVAQLNLADGIPALLFDRAGAGCLITWNENFPPQQDDPSHQIELFVGENPVRVDLFGNRTPLPVRNGLARLQLDQWPVIITGVNTALAHLRASLRLEPEVLDASFLRQAAQLKFTNPFKMSVSGRLRLLLNLPQYQNWVVDPPFINFTLRPGETLVQNLSIKFPRNELAGKKQLEKSFIPSPLKSASPAWTSISSPAVPVKETSLSSRSSPTSPITK